MNTNFESNELDRIIERALQRDAESLRSRLESEPNAGLTAKLAMRTASRGLLRSLGAKFALYACAAALVAGVIYFWPQNNIPNPPSAISHPIIPNSIPSNSAPSNQATPMPATVSPIATPPTNESVGTKIERNPMRHHPTSLSNNPVVVAPLSDSSSKQIPVLTDRHYHGPAQ